MSPLYRWTVDNVPLRWRVSKKQVIADNYVLTRHYRAQAEMLKSMTDQNIDLRARLRKAEIERDDWKSYALDQQAYAAAAEAESADIRAQRDANLDAFRDVCAHEENLQEKIALLKNACDEADERAAALGRNGRLGTKAIRKLLG